MYCDPGFADISELSSDYGCSSLVPACKNCSWMFEFRYLTVYETSHCFVSCDCRINTDLSSKLQGLCLNGQ